jgi:hypothetical protein
MSEPFKPEAVLVDYRPMLNRVIENAKVGLPTSTSEKAYSCWRAYLTILQSTIGAKKLLRESTTITIGGVVRSILESYADLCALARDFLYARRMLATLYEQRLRLFQDMIASPFNRYHASLAQQL